jgi:hypothetical protein
LRAKGPLSDAVRQTLARDATVLPRSELALASMGMQHSACRWAALLHLVPSRRLPKVV